MSDFNYNAYINKEKKLPKNNSSNTNECTLSHWISSQKQNLAEFCSKNYVYIADAKQKIWTLSHNSNHDSR